MPDRRKHRGAHPDDARLFSDEALLRLKSAVADYSWHLSRGYSPSAAASLVGNRYQLQARQRTAMRRIACSEKALARRRATEVSLEQRPFPLLIDGFNLIITIESALGGAVVLEGRDRCIRDLAGLRGTYRIVSETRPAVEAIGRVLSRYRVPGVRWIFDRPVSNSGRLAELVQSVAHEHQWAWITDVRDHADDVLASSADAVATADSAVIDRASRWLNLGRVVVLDEVPDAWLVRV